MRPSDRESPYMLEVSITFVGRDPAKKASARTAIRASAVAAGSPVRNGPQPEVPNVSGVTLSPVAPRGTCSVRITMEPSRRLDGESPGPRPPERRPDLHLLRLLHLVPHRRRLPPRCHG